MERSCCKRNFAAVFLYGGMEGQAENCPEQSRGKAVNGMEVLVTGSQMKELDAYTIKKMGVPSLVLMERAGLAVYQEMLREKLPLDKTLVLCGGGNNGADGVVIARLLFLAGHKVDVCILGNPDHFTEEMKKQIEIGKKYGLSFVNTFLEE